MKLPNVLLQGHSGTGKSTALLTLIPADITPFIIATEANALMVYGRVPCPKLHYRYIKAGAPTWGAMREALVTVNTLSNDLLQKMAGVQKERHNQILDVVGACANFKCDRCGKEFGDITSWGEDRAIVFDSYSGINDLAMMNTVGGKPILTQPDWGVAMRSEHTLLQMMTNIPTALFICIAHLASERDLVTGATQVVPSALGTKNAPDMPRMFTDVITACREGTKFRWSTVEANHVAAARHVPWSGDIPTDFGPLMAEWRRLNKQAEAA